MHLVLQNPISWFLGLFPRLFAKWYLIVILIFALIAWYFFRVKPDMGKGNKGQNQYKYNQ